MLGSCYQSVFWKETSGRVGWGSSQWQDDMKRASILDLVVYVLAYRWMEGIEDAYLRCRDDDTIQIVVCSTIKRL